MKYQSKTNNTSSPAYGAGMPGSGEMVATLQKTEDFETLFQQYRLPGLDDLLTKLMARAGKRSFLVFRNKKYLTVATENIAFFNIKHESSTITCFDGQEYCLSQSLDQIQNLLTDHQFYRLNRQYLINFNAVKEVEHYFARKLLVNLVVPAKDKLLVPKEKVSSFLHWLDYR